MELCIDFAELRGIVRYTITLVFDHHNRMSRWQTYGRGGDKQVSCRYDIGFHFLSLRGLLVHGFNWQWLDAARWS